LKKRYFKLLHADGKHGLLISGSEDPQVDRLIDGFRQVGQEVEEINGNEARSLRARQQQYDSREKEREVTA